MGKKNSLGELRKGKNMTQAQVAARLNVDRTTVNKWESGASHPRLEVLPKLAFILGCPISRIFDNWLEW